MALSKDAKITQVGTPDSPSPLVLAFPVAAATTIYAGAIVATGTDGYAVPATNLASGLANYKVWGRAKRQVVNTTAAGFGSAGQLTVEIERGCFFYLQSGTTITKSDVGKRVYAADDTTVTLTTATGSNPLAGVVFAVDSNRSDSVGVLLGDCVALLGL
jgi:predicted RecA/RadA family phage recombinase